MKKYLFFLCFFIFNTHYLQADPDKTINDSDQMVARIEHIFMSLQEYKTRARRTIEEYKKNNRYNIENLRTLKKTLLKRIIEKKLLLIEAENKQIEVSYKEILDAKDEIKKSFDDYKEYKNNLKKHGLHNEIDLRKYLESELKVKKLLYQEIGDCSTETDKDLEYLDKNYERYIIELRKKYIILIFNDCADIAF